MSIQSLTTPATFIVRALVRPISKKTDILSPNAAVALDKKMGTCSFRWCLTVLYRLETTSNMNQKCEGHLLYSLEGFEGLIDLVNFDTPTHGTTLLHQHKPVVLHEAHCTVFIAH